MNSTMDSISDLSLLEIAGEDDSLLSFSSANSSTSANVFSCSPLLSLRSRPLQITPLAEGIEIANSEDLTLKDNANKENSKWSEPEAPASQQSHQKKRKKKFGGFNLRKSLAWDRAFLTEQGVLNPTELSMISGMATPNSKSNLEVIDEEEPATTSKVLRRIEENLFKHSSGGVSIREKKIGAVSGLSPKPGASVKRTSSFASLAKRKVLATNNVGNKYKRSACPRDIPSSSTDTAKTPSKESKISRIPGPKSNVSANVTTTRSGTVSLGSSKRNLNAHPVTNVPKYVGVKGQSKNPTTVPSIPSLSKNPTTTVPSIPRLAKNPTTTVPSIPRLSKNPTTTVPSIPKVDMADKCSVSRPLGKQAGKHLVDSSVSVVRPPSRMVSGLRMPTPSIGFFSQVKASSSHSQLQKSSIPCKPSEHNIPKLRKLETVSVKEARSKIVKGAAKNHTEELSLSEVKSETMVQIDNKKMAGVEVECDSSSFEISKQAEVENILDDVILKSKEQGELHENEIVSSMENMVLPTLEKEFLTKSQTHEQLEKEAGHALDNKLYDVSSNVDWSLYQEPQSMLCPIMQRTSNTVQNATRQDEDDQIKGPTSDILTFKESLVLQAEDGTSFNDGRHSGEFKEYSSVKTALLNSSLDDFSKTVPKGSKQGSPCKNTEQVNSGADEFGRYEGDAQVHLLNESLSINCKKTTQSNLEEVSQQLLAVQLKALNPSVEEIGPGKENISDMNSSLPVHVTTVFSKGSPEKSILEINGVSVDESKIVEIKDCQLPEDDQSGFIPRSPMDKECYQVIGSKTIHDRTLEFELDGLSENGITVSANACCTNITPERKPFPENNVKNLHLTPQLCPINDSSPISESQIKDDNFSTDSSIHCEVQCDVPGNIEKQASMFTHPEINVISCKDESLGTNHGHLLHQSEISEVSADLISNIENAIGSGAENSSGLLQHTLLAQSVQEFDHTYREIEESHEEDAQVQSLNENPVAYNCSNEHCFAVTNEEQASMFTHPEINEISCKYESLGTNHGHLLHQSEISEVSADLISNIENAIGSGAENSSGLLQHALLAQSVQELDHTYREIEDAEVQSLNKNSVAYDCSNEHCLAVTNDQLSLADDDNINEDSHIPEFQKPSAIVAVDSQDVINILHLDGDCVSTNIASSAEIEEQNLVEGAFEGCRVHTNEPDASNNHISRDIEESHVEHAQAQSFNENPVAYDCSSKVCLAVINDQFSVADDNNINEDSHLPEFQKPSAVVTADSQDDQLDRDFLPTVIVSSTEIKDQHLVEDAFEGCGLSSEHNVSNHHIEDTPVNDVVEKVDLLQINDAEDGIHDVDEKVELLQINGAEDGNYDIPINKDGNHDVDEKVELLQINDVEDGNHDVDEKVELLQINGAEDGSSDILPLFEIQLDVNVISAQFDSSTEVSEDPFTMVVALKSEEQCLLSENSKLLASDMPVNKDGNHYVDEKEELLQINGAEEGSSDILPVVEMSEEGLSDMLPLVEVQLNENVISAEFNSSIQVSQDPFTSVVSLKSEEQCLLSENSKLLSSDMLVNNDGNHDVDEKVEFLQINDVEDGNHDVDEKVELLQINGAEDGSSNISPSVEIQLDENVISAQFDSSTEVSEQPFKIVVALKSEEQCFLSENSKLLASDIPVNKDENHDVDEKVELLQINDVEDGNHDVDEKVELLQINDVYEKVELLQINDLEDGNHNVDEKMEVLQINDVEDGNRDVDEKVEFLQINDAEEGSSDILPLVEIHLNENFLSAEFDSSTEVSEDPFTTSVSLKSELLSSEIPVNKDGSQDVDEKVELLRVTGAEEGSLDISPSDEIQLNENAISAELDSSIEVSEDLFTSVVALRSEEECLVSEKSKLLASENPIFNATIPQGSEDSAVKLNENAISAELDSSVEVSEEPFTSVVALRSEEECLASEKSKLLASENPIFNATIPQGSEDSSVKLNEIAISAELDSSIEVSEDPFTSVVALKAEEECFVSEKSKLLASENPIFNATIPQGSEDSSVKLNEIAISADLDSSIEVSEDPFTSVVALKAEEECFVSEKSKLLASENPIFNATIPQGSEDSSLKLNENTISAELDSSVEVSEEPFPSVVALKSEEDCLASEKSKLLASENPIFNATIPQGSEDILVKLNENAISAELDSSIEVSEDPFTSVVALRSEEGCLASEKSKLLASENPIFNATIPLGSEDSSVKLNENAISAELDSSVEVSEEPFTSVVALKSEEECLASEKSKLLASENPIFNATIPQGSEDSSVKLNENAISAELGSSIEVSEDHFTSVVGWKSEEQCLLSEKSKLLASNNPTSNATIPQGIEISSVNSKSLSDVAVTIVFENDKSPNTDMLSQTKDNTDFPEDNSKIIHLEKDATKTKQEVSLVKPPPNVAPFTEEWLAAIEAAGEEILTMKSGAVQNSPPDKTQQEPNPWSPVKKNQTIGPFDCTKVTKPNHQNSDPSCESVINH